MKLNFLTICLLLPYLSVAGATRAHADFDDKPTSKEPMRVPTPIPTATSSTKSKSGTTTKSSESDSSTNTETQKSTPNTNNAFEHDTNAPVNYRAESGSGSRKDGTMELVKNVVITQAQTTMWADKAELFSVPGSTKPKRVVARGHVKLYKKPSPQGVEMRASADEIEYFADTQKAILRGRPVIQKGKEVLRGEQIEVDMQTEAIKVKNPSGVVDPKEESSSNSKKPESKKRK